MSLSTVDAFKHIEYEGDTIEVSGERLTQFQAVLTEMLKDIDMVCTANDITYTLGGGTCLGAVRHHGFIPWDDDIDLNMSRRDFERFVVAIQDAFPGKYTVHVPGQTENYELGLGRIRLRGTVVRCKEDFHLPDSECGAYVDLFIIDNAPDFAPLRFLHGFVSMALGFALSCRRFATDKDEFLKLAGSNKEVAKTFKKKAAIGRLFSFLPVETWLKAWDKWNGLLADKETGYATIPVGRRHYFKEMHRRSEFFPVSYGEFEGLRVPLPADTDAYLTALYGPDYMTPPPEAEREHHVVLTLDLGERSKIEEFKTGTSR